MAKLTIRIGDDKKAKWQATCNDNGTTASEAMRQYIDSQIKDHMPPSRPRAQRKAQKKVEVSIRLTESEIQGIALRQRLNGGTRAAWIIKVIRAALTRQPVFDDAEVQAINDSSSELNAIGKNLNQIARRLHEKQKTQQAIDILRIRKEINEHIDTVSALVDVNRSRWNILG